MVGQARPRVNPQARGRELARAGTRLWQELGSVGAAAAEVRARYPDIVSMQAFRYACGLSQDQAAARYNEATGHQTSLGGTTINAWETWARRRGGSPPPFSGLLILADAYGRGPLGVADESISPGDLVMEAYERLSPEDQLALKANAGTGHTRRETAPGLRAELGQPIGRNFYVSVPTTANGNPLLQSFSLPNPEKSQLRHLTWGEFGFGIERLVRQIKNLGRHLDVDACFGINEAGLVMATFLASAQFRRCPVGYLRCMKDGDTLGLDDTSHYPLISDSPTIVICDFEVKHADVVGFVAREIRARYPGAKLYFAVFGAMTLGTELEVSDLDQLTGSTIMKAAGFEAIFIAATMSPPGIEPPLELR
jgi:hypothetical protein